MLLSVCIIIRNDIARLSRAINSVQDIADETVIVLTEDISVESFINAHNIKVYSYNWEGSYQDARNFALKKARGDWVLFLEVNEELSSDFNQLRALLQQTENSGFYLPVIQIKNDEDYHLEREIDAPQLSLRLFRNKGSYYYSGDLYEDITPSILAYSSQNRLKALQLPIISSFPFRIIPRELDPFSLYYLDFEREESHLYPLLEKGIKLFWKGKVENAINELEKGYRRAKKAEGAFLLKNLILLLLKQKQFKKAGERIKEGLWKFPGYNIFHFWRGYLSLIMGDSRKAVHYLGNTLTRKEQNLRLKGNIYFLLGLAYQELDDYVLSEFFLNKASKLIPTRNLPVNALINNCRHKKENTTRIISTLKEPGNELIYKLMEVYYNHQEYSKALEVLNQIDDNKDENKNLFWKGKIMLHLGNYSETHQSLKRISPAFQYYPEVLDLLWLINIYKKPHKESRSVINQIKFLGDTITWNIIKVFNNIYFHGKGVYFKFNSMVTRFKFYQKLLYYLELLIEYEGHQDSSGYSGDKGQNILNLNKNNLENNPVDIMKEIIRKLKIRRATGDIGLLYYKHKRWEEAYTYLKRDLKNGKALPELLLMAEICFKLGREKEGRKYRMMAIEIDEYYEKAFFGYKKRNVIAGF